MKSLKSKIFRRNVIIAVSTCIVVLSGMIIFAMNYQMPLPFDPTRMSVELIPVAVAVDETGNATWLDLDIISEAIQYEYIRDSLWISWQGFSRVAIQAAGRDIIRDGESIRVVYYIHTITPWNSVFYDDDLTGSGRITGTQIYGERFHTAHREPQSIEIHYLPIRNFGRLHNLSDENFDAERYNGFLIWSGVK